MEEDSERREGARRRILKTAKIVFNDGRSTIDCLVRNQSDSGARLKIATVVGVPDEFELSIMGSRPRACHVIWRTAEELGIRYHGA
jgi:PilZ domain